MIFGEILEWIGTIIGFVLVVGGLKIYNAYRVHTQKSKKQIREESREDLNTIIRMQERIIDEQKAEIKAKRQKISDLENTIYKLLHSKLSG